ncbi:MAG: phosphate regulon sensor histidine kinase PhoR [Alphaproteobacteria bacterium]|nr:phosphate regulon sensor histidine kinase PhoR [Alphaproteobacteria bacterium]
MSFLLALMLGLVSGAFIAPEQSGIGGLWGMLAASILWFFLDLWSGLWVKRWLSRPHSQAPAAWGGWGEIVDRVQRLVRVSERQLSASQVRLEQFLSAIQASPNGVLMLDADMRIAWCNTMAAQHLGIDPARDMAQLIGNLVRHPDFSRYLQQGEHAQRVVIDGREHRPDHPQRIALQLFAYGDGQYLLLSQDITAVEQSEAMRRDFVANVSHEIRTPLTVLAGFVETLLSLDLTPDQQKSYLKLMERQSQRMQSLVDDLLTLSRLEGSPMPGREPTPLSVFWTALKSEAQALDEVMAGIWGGLHEVVFDPPEPPDWACLGQRTELQSAMSNLVANALRYTQVGGQVCVSWKWGSQGEGIFTVSDNGPGIAPEHVPRITERFYRVDRSRLRETGGTGLGLAIVKHVVQRHGGELIIASELGRGSSFSIMLPAHRVQRVSGGADGE